MEPPRSRAAPSKRAAATRNPSPDLQAAVDELNLHLLQAASDGDLRLLKMLLWALDKSRWDPREVVEAAKDEGVGALHLAAANGRLPVCRYLVEELGVDVDAVDDDYVFILIAQTPLIWAIHGGKLDTVSYLLDHGANPSKVDDQGFTPLHYATGAGDREMVELLLAKGVPVDPVSVSGTPLHIAASEGRDEAMKVLLENNADYNKKVRGVDTPLLVAITASSVKCIKLLVEAGADVNDGLETPLAAAANKGLTACLKCLLEADTNTGEHVRRIVELKSLAVKALKRNDYLTAATLYSAAMEHDRHDATLLSNRSLCWLRMGDGHKALQDALVCREMRPGWPKGCYRQGAALMLLKVVSKIIWLASLLLIVATCLSLSFILYCVIIRTTGVRAMLFWMQPSWTRGVLRSRLRCGRL